MGNLELEILGLEDLFKLISEHGTLTTLIVIIFLVISMLSKANLLGDISKIFTKFKRKERKISQISVRDSDIIHHEIFNLVDFWVYSKIPTLTLNTEFRTVVFRKYLHIYFKSYKDVLHIFVNGGKFKKLDNSELRQSLLKLITDIVFEYESEMRKVGLPDIIISGMKSKNNDTLNLTMDLINSICDSDFYNSENNLLKIYSFLNIVLSILENTLSHCEEVSNSINGQMVGLTYGGYTET